MLLRLSPIAIEIPLKRATVTLDLPAFHWDPPSRGITIKCLIDSLKADISDQCCARV